MNQQLAEKNKKIRALVVDDHPLLLSGIKSAISIPNKIEIVGEATDGKSAIKKAKDLVPDIVLMDIKMPNMNGIEATREMLKDNADIKVIILSGYDTAEYVHQALSAGAVGFILKDSPSSEIVAAIQAITEEKESFFSPKISKILLNSVIKNKIAKKSSTNDTLSIREREVLALIAGSLKNKEISERLGIGIRTVETHRERLMNKLDLHDVAGLTRYAILSGIAS